MADSETTEEKKDPDAEARKLANLRPWKPGQSGNPGGRPKGLRAQVLEATNGGRDIVAVLVEILTSARAKHADRLKAGEILLDRGFGKAVAVTLNAQAGSVDGLPDGLTEAADALLEGIARRLSTARPGQLADRTQALTAVNLPAKIDDDTAQVPATVQESQK